MKTIIGPLTLRISERAADVLHYLGMRAASSKLVCLVAGKRGIIPGYLAGILLSLLPRPGIELTNGIRRVFGKNRIEAWLLCLQKLSRPFRDVIGLKRLILGYDSPDEYTIIEKNVEAISSLRRDGRSYIIAAGHFTRQAAVFAYTKSITPAQVVCVTLPVPKGKLSLREHRVQLHLGTLLGSVSAVRSSDLEYVEVGPELKAGKRLMRLLADGNTAAIIHVDVPQQGDTHGSFERAFAGSRRQSFSTGSARLARFCKCPIITCLWYVEDNLSVVLEWGEPDFSYRNGDKASDIIVMNRLLDQVEVAIGKRPGQYVLDIGMERKWDAAIEAWVDG